MGAAAKLVIVDDEQGRFGPLCDLRGVAELRTGAWTTREWLSSRFGPAVAIREKSELTDLTREATGVDNRLPDEGDDFLVVNARLADRRANEALTNLARGEAITEPTTFVAARVTRQHAMEILQQRVIPTALRVRESSVSLLARPWDLLAGLSAAISADVVTLAHANEYTQLPDQHASRMGPHPVVIHTSAAIGPYVVFDATLGPIHIGPNATVRPLSVICGPASIGAGSTITERSLIKPNVSCGGQCRLGGEIGNTSIASCSNKTHDGHLGDSIVGSWVNLGAGTDNSNLLNTYGEVSMRLDLGGSREKSGRIFLGSIIGDHVKCAIGTRLMTGTVVGTGAMIASSTAPPPTTRRFAWRTDEGERRYALDKFLDVAQTVMARRQVTPGPAYLARIQQLYQEVETSID